MGQKVALIHRLLQTDFDILGRISVCEIRAVHVWTPTCSYESPHLFI